MSNGKVCNDCESSSVYYIEFRMDNTHTHNLQKVNNEDKGIKHITDNDLPKYLGGYYCHQCESFCSLKEK